MGVAYRRGFADSFGGSRDENVLAAEIGFGGIDCWVGVMVKSRDEILT
jgi:hypothetical protein